MQDGCQPTCPPGGFHRTLYYPCHHGCGIGLRFETWNAARRVARRAPSLSEWDYWFAIGRPSGASHFGGGKSGLPGGEERPVGSQRSTKRGRRAGRRRRSGAGRVGWGHVDSLRVDHDQMAHPQAVLGESEPASAPMTPTWRSGAEGWPGRCHRNPCASGHLGVVHMLRLVRPGLDRELEVRLDPTDDEARRHYQHRGKDAMSPVSATLATKTLDLGLCLLPRAFAEPQLRAARGVALPSGWG